MGMPFLLGTDYLRKIQSVRPQNLVSLWPQNEPAGGISTEIVRGYDGAYTGVTLGQPGVPGSGLTSAGYDGVTSYNDIYTAGLANDTLLLNPGFETAGAGDPDFWANWIENVTDGVLANEVVVVHEGVDAAKMTGGVGFSTHINQGFVAIPSQRYRLRFWTQGDGANAGRYRIRDITNGVDIVGNTTTGIAGAAYGMVATEFTAPAGCVSALIYLYCPPVNGGICYFDACEVRRMDGFLGDQGTVIVPAQVANAGVWTDGTLRRVWNSRVDAANRIIIGRTVVNNEIGFNYISGGINESVIVGGLTTTAFMILGLTWDKAADAMMAYYNGIQTGLTQTIGGTWVGDLLATDVAIGAENIVPINVWLGNIAPLSVWSDALSPDEMRYLGT